MAEDLFDDLSAWYELKPNGFADPAVVSLTGGGTRPLPVIWDADRRESTLSYGRTNAADVVFLARCQTKDMVGVDAENQIVIDGMTYRIKVKQADSKGETFMELKRQNS